MQMVCTSLRSTTSPAPGTVLMVVSQFYSLMQSILVLSHKRRMIIQSLLPPIFSLKLKFSFWTGVETVTVYSRCQKKPHAWSDLLSFHRRRGIYAQVRLLWHSPWGIPMATLQNVAPFFSNSRIHVPVMRYRNSPSISLLVPLLLGPSRSQGI